MTTAGRILAISSPSLGSNRISQTSPRAASLIQVFLAVGFKDFKVFLRRRLECAGYLPLALIRRQLQQFPDRIRRLLAERLPDIIQHLPFLRVIQPADGFDDLLV